jgi:hypothetical protein
MKKLKKLLYSILVFLFMSLIVTNCNSIRKSAIRNSLKGAAIEDFDKFYRHFHTDSLFQMSRIRFPLEGLIVDGSGEKRWTKGNWTLMKTKIYDIDTTKFKIDYKKSDKTFIQKFWLENSGFSSEYRFELVNNKWYLVYALDQNL